MKTEPFNYDAWLDLAGIEEENLDFDAVRDTFELAIAQIPEQLEKKYWKRYIYLWMFYAIFEEN